jgi:arylsulfatase A-like enzyme
MLVQLGFAGPSEVLAQTPVDEPPNVLVIITDDQRLDLMEDMPKTRRWLGKNGTTFSQAFTTDPQCCPARASLFTGKYPHNHGVEENGQVSKLDLSTTMQHYLDQAGYHTGLVGKYFIRWGLQEAPPDFDDFSMGQIGISARRSNYYDTKWNMNGNIRQVATYSTEFIRRRSLSFLRKSETNSDDTPWFLYMATSAPHKPMLPEEKYWRTPVRPWFPQPPAISETDLSDKPPWFQGYRASGRWGSRRSQIRMMRSVDDMVDSVMRWLKEHDERNTLVIFTSDHGYFWGEHGLSGKGDPHFEGVAIPLLMRWPDHVESGDVDDRLASIADIAPTVMEAAGVEPDPTQPMDGTSLLSATERDHLLIEFFGTKRTPPWAAIRSNLYHYIVYYDEEGDTLFREYYDVLSDPSQLNNALADADPNNDPSPADAALVEGLLEAARVCKGITCP